MLVLIATWPSLLVALDQMGLEGNLTAGRKVLALSAVIPTIDATSFRGSRIAMFLPACPLKELFLGARILGFFGCHSYLMFGHQRQFGGYSHRWE